MAISKSTLVYSMNLERKNAQLSIRSIIISVGILISNIFEQNPKANSSIFVTVG